MAFIILRVCGGVEMSLRPQALALHIDEKRGQCGDFGFQLVRDDFIELGKEERGVP